MMLLHLLPFIATSLAYVVHKGSECHLYPESTTHDGKHVDDSPSILKAFDLCGKNGKIIFSADTFYVNKIMKTTNLLNCDISLYGELVWSTDVAYWRAHSIPVAFQNTSTAWLFGGTNVNFRGYGQGKFNGNGQTWYNEDKGESNQPGRPIAITIYNSKNVLLDGISWAQSQFWHSFISHSQGVTMSNIFMKSVSNNGKSTINTDGLNTWNSKDITLTNWSVQNGDDCIAIKGNSTNVHARNITCHQSGGIPIGSVGQILGHPDYVQNILFEDVTLIDSNNGAFIKAWQGVPTTNDSNNDEGGGGGGFAKNITFRNFHFENVRLPVYITECIFGKDPSVCDTSLFKISDITWENFSGTSQSNLMASIHCSALVPCPGLKFVNFKVKSNAKRNTPLIYQCANIVNQNATGVHATGIPCNKWAPNNYPD